MTFKELKNTICPAYKTYSDAVRAAERRWLVSNRPGAELWVRVYLNAWGEDEANVQVTAGRAEYSQPIGLGEATSRELQLFMGVRRLVDQWLQNELPELPQVLPDALTDIAD